MPLFNFAAGNGVPLAAEPIFHIGGFGFTNAMFYGIVVAVILTVIFMMAARRTNVKPTNKLAFVIETLVETVIQLGEDNFGSRKKALRHMPLLLTLFIFILFWNLSGLIPGVGSIHLTTDGHVSPLLRPFTTDLNATLAMAVLTIGLVQFWALRELGLVRHIKHYFSVVTPWWNPMNAFIGLIEVMGEFIRIITLSMRLFGVIYAGEVLIHVIADLGGNFGPIATFPVYLMEIFFSGIQAYLFMMLSMVYMANATHSDDHPEDDPGMAPQVVKVTG